MWQEFYDWIEKYNGCTYDLTDDIRQISGDEIFINPMGWKINVQSILESLDEMVDIIDAHKNEVTDVFPSYIALRNFVIGETMTSLIEVVNSIKQKLHIEPTNINNVDTFSDHMLNLYELVNAVSVYSLEQLSKMDWFDEFEEDHDNFFEKEFGLAKQDLTNIHFVVNDIIQLYEDE